MNVQDQNIAAIARAAALRLHEGRLYGDRPYREHLEAVVAVLARFGIDHPKIVAASWDHDLIEDGLATAAELAALGLPHGVLAIVEAVTDEPGGNRRERKARTYPKIVALRGAVIVKLADRIANVEAGGTRAMYAKEHAAFRAALYRPEHGLDALWAHLDRIIL